MFFDMRRAPFTSLKRRVITDRNEAVSLAIAAYLTVNPGVTP